MTQSLLDRIVASARQRAAQRRALLPLARLEAQVRPDPGRGRRYVTALAQPELAFVAALERASPSGGRMLSEDPLTRAASAPRAGPRWRELAAALLAGGIDALVVGTESDHYDGELEDLESVAFTGLPVMRADFLVDEGMVLESALHGAHAVQLIAAILDDYELARLRAAARALGLAVMIEVHHEHDLERTLPLEPELVGVNARDRRTLAMDSGVFERLFPRIPRPSLRVALSGLATSDDMRRVRAVGADVALVGSSIMRAADPVGLLASWRAAVRRSR
ncbi:MAG: indole-3-glycerol-phosphate synthase [Planctomycetes bacterium]|nr:indole-3-glycerol-phosphate synthase [Planctomycetota bacterium]